MQPNDMQNTLALVEDSIILPHHTGKTCIGEMVVVANLELVLGIAKSSFMEITNQEQLGHLEILEALAISHKYNTINIVDMERNSETGMW
jgi:hypothetical protein